jgi:hypothetical protein
VKRTIAASASIVCLVTALAVTYVRASTAEGFLLKVTLVDPGATTDIQTRIVALEPFEHSEMHNGARITIKGELSASNNGSYRLRLAIAEWRDEKTNSTERYEVDLTPGKAEGRGFVSSFIYQRVILLTRLPKP